MGITYKDSGVSIEAGNNFVKKISPLVKATFDKNVISDIGGFGALYNASFPEMKEPVLVSGTDGVGTKLKVAQMADKHDTIGIDAVAMCVNDILVSGAKPLFFLDYLSCGKLKENVMVDIVKGIAEGCLQAGCSLVGGETAEHPGVMPDDDYDIGGFSVGVVDRSKMIDGKKITAGDVIIGVDSNGLHSNGFSFVRKIFFDVAKNKITDNIPEFGKPLFEELLRPTRIYCKQVLSIIEKGTPLKGLVHITGGGFYENVPRIFQQNTACVIEKNSYEVPAVFKLIQKIGNVDEREMYTTFNMGIGLMIIAAKTDADSIISSLKAAGDNARVIGEIIKSDKKEVVLK